MFENFEEILSSLFRGFYFPLTFTNCDLNSEIDTLFLFLSSYSDQSPLSISTSSNVWPLSMAFTMYPDRGSNSTGSIPRQSNETIVLKFPESSSVYEPLW